MSKTKKLLILATNQLGLFYTRLGDEARQIKAEINSSPFREQVAVITETAVRVGDITKLLLDHRPDAIHFSGHASATEGLILEDDLGNRAPVGPGELAAVLRVLKDNVRLVFYNVCHTVRYAEAAAEVVDCAIGMNGEVEDDSALAFSASFYRALASGRAVREAFDLATKELDLRALKGSSIPVLFPHKQADLSRPFVEVGARPSGATQESRPRPSLDELNDQFAAQLRVAGQFYDPDGSSRAIRLDDNLYVRRASAEEAVLGEVDKFLESSPPEGRWLSLVADAGHGKSSLLWHLHRGLTKDERLEMLPFLAQLEGRWEPIEAAALDYNHRLAGHRAVVVIIDTLDILVGTDDPKLAAGLNRLRAAGCLVITASRRQEVDRLMSLTPCDRRVELRRYSRPEARQAIRNYVDLAYPGWDADERGLQFAKVWGLVEQQRDARELDFEPLILRMLFEAYVPEDIPPDINTRQVYRRFWQERVLFDRVVKEPAVRFLREQACRVMARELAFGGAPSETIGLERILEAWQRGGKQPQQLIEVVDGLVSTGVLQWVHGASTLRFFHQTFLEYTAAYDMICSDHGEAEGRIGLILEDVANFRFFRAPILKQFAIQVYEVDRETWKNILCGLREVNNELAARMAFEIVGKLPDDDFAVELCRGWIRDCPEVPEHVILDCARNYPRRKAAVALTFVEPYARGARATAIYSLCAETLAKDAPTEACEFLRRQMEAVKTAGDDEQKHYKEALVAAARSGATRAFTFLVELFPHLKPGQQAGLLNGIEKITGSENAGEVADFLKGVVSALRAGQVESPTEVWDALLKSADRLYAASADSWGEFSGWLFAQGFWRRHQMTALYTGMILGRGLSDPRAIDKSLDAIASDDHAVRMFNSGMLTRAPGSFSALILDAILALDKDRYREEAKFASLFAVVAGLKYPDPKKVIRFLKDWPWSESGVGTPLRKIVEGLAGSDPAATKKWLLEEIKSGQGAVADKLSSAFSILARAHIDVFDAAEIRELYEIAFRQPAAVRQRFAGSVGNIAKIDAALAGTIFSMIMKTEGAKCQVAAANSLANCLATQPEFALAQGPVIIETALAKRHLGLLHGFLIVLKGFPSERARELLARLDEWFTAERLERIADQKAFGELLGVLKILADQDPKLVFEISGRIPVLNKAVAGGLAALYDRVSEHAEAGPLMDSLLESVARVSRYNQVRMGNALKRILPRVDHKLGGRKVVEMFFRTYKQIEDLQALKSLIEAVLKVPSWTHEDTERLLKDLHLHPSLRAILSRA